MFGRSYGVLVVLGVLGLSAINLGATYGGGSGTAENPYQIWKSWQLNAIGANSGDWGKHFKLMADIDMSAYSGTSYKIIGSVTKYFTGTFDGNGHVIRNLTYTTTDYVPFVGLFGYISNATIKNLGVENVKLSTGGYCAGGLVGKQADGGMITNCFSSGSVTVSSTPDCYLESCAGGLVGYLSGEGVMQNCHSTASVYAASSRVSSIAGGLVGEQMKSVPIINCYSTGSVSSSSPSYTYSGGLTGTSHGMITNCYSTSSVISSSTNVSYAGGLVGSGGGSISSCFSTGSASSLSSKSTMAGGLVGLYQGEIVNCYSSASVNSSSTTATSYAGGLVAKNDGFVSNCYCTGVVLSDTIGPKKLGGLTGSGFSVFNSFWDIQTSGINTSPGGKGRTTAQLKQYNNYVGWNTPDQTNWAIHDGVDYPRLLWENQQGTPLSAQTFSDFIPGAGTLSDPYRISTPEQLNVVGLFPDVLDKVFCLENDIDLSVIAGMEFNRIGIDYTKSFTGIFDGKGHIISNLNYTPTNYVFYVGLFGCIKNNAVIKNLGLDLVNIHAANAAAGCLVGYLFSGTIVNCYSSGSITNDTSESSYSSSTGGLVGFQSSGLITDCYSRTYINMNSTSDFSHSYAGGLAGRQSSGTIERCYSMSSVVIRIREDDEFSDAYAGGLAGYQMNNSAAKIQQCYASGFVSVSGINIYEGGVLGNQEGSDSIINVCFWDVQTSGLTTGVGSVNIDGVYGKTTGEMQMLSTFSSAGWDFSGEPGNGANDYWRMCADGVDYPRLSWEFGRGGDFSCPDGVGVEDLEALATKWLTIQGQAGYHSACDANGDGRIDMADFEVLADGWMGN